MLTDAARAALARLESRGGEAAEDVATLRHALAELEERLRPHAIADRAATALATVAAMEPVVRAAVEAQRRRDDAAASEHRHNAELALAQVAALEREGERRWGALTGAGEAVRSAGQWLAARSAHAVTALLGGVVTWLLLRLGVALPAASETPDTPPIEADGGDHG